MIRSRISTSVCQSVYLSKNLYLLLSCPNCPFRRAACRLAADLLTERLVDVYRHLKCKHELKLAASKNKKNQHMSEIDAVHIPAKEYDRPYL